MTSYARTEVLVITLVGAALAAIAWWWGGPWSALAPAALALALLSFYRDPPRRIPPGADLLLSPADGKVVEISRDVALPDGRRGLRIVIFLSVLNVHVNRSPCAGNVTAVRYQPGKFLNALNPESNRQNESNTLTLSPRSPLAGPIEVRQIAGLLARRIVCAARIGDTLEAGQRYGMIKLGSRTEITAPEDSRWQVAVRVGQSVAGGTTILARWT